MSLGTKTIYCLPQNTCAPMRIGCEHDEFFIQPFPTFAQCPGVHRVHALKRCIVVRETDAHHPPASEIPPRVFRLLHMTLHARRCPQDDISSSAKWWHAPLQLLDSFRVITVLPSLNAIHRLPAVTIWARRGLPGTLLLFLIDVVGIVIQLFPCVATSSQASQDVSTSEKSAWDVVDVLPYGRVVGFGNRWVLHCFQC